MDRPSFEQIISMPDKEFEEKYLKPQLEEMGYTLQEFRQITDKSVEELPF